MEIFLPNSQAVNYTDTQYPLIARAKELDALELRIDQFSNVLNEYNTLYLEEQNYTPGLNIFVTTFSLAVTTLCVLALATTPEEEVEIGRAHV